MAQALTWLGAAALALALPCGAQALTDPTKPPSAFLRALAQADSAKGGAPAPAAPAEPQLQSVLLAPGRQVAVIDGEPVALGGTFRGARVTRITSTSVELMRGRERQLLRLAAPNEAKAEPTTRP